MPERFKTLRVLSTVFFVMAWLTVAGTLYALFSAQVLDVREFDYTGVGVTTKEGIGVVGAITIVVDGAIRFVALLGISQAIKLWLDLHGSISGLGGRLGDVTAALTNVEAEQAKIGEQVRVLGSMVYEQTHKKT